MKHNREWSVINIIGNYTLGLVGDMDISEHRWWQQTAFNTLPTIILFKQNEVIALPVASHPSVESSSHDIFL